MSTTCPDRSKATAANLTVTQPDIETLREPLLDLWKRNLPGASPERFDWLYASGHSQAWLLEESGSGVIGSAGRISRRLAIAGNVAEAGVAIDLNVDEKKRSLGPALSLVREVAASAEREGMPLIYAIPIRAAASVMKLARYRQLGEMTSWTKLLRSEFKLSRVLRSPRAARLAAPIVDTAMRLFDWARRTRLPVGITSEAVSEFDDRFDRLWRSVIGQWSVIGERTASFLSWRFLKCPAMKYQIFTLVNQRTRDLAGYVIWSTINDSILISDLLAVDPASTTQLLAEFTRMVRRTTATAIRLSCFASADFYQALQSAGFSRRMDGLSVLVKTFDETTAAAVDPATDHHWYLTMADNDVDG